MKWLEYKRRLAGHTQETLSKGASVGRSRISELECGRLIPTEHSVELRKLAAFLGVPEAEARCLIEDVEVESL